MNFKWYFKEKKTLTFQRNGMLLVPIDQLLKRQRNKIFLRDHLKALREKANLPVSILHHQLFFYFLVLIPSKFYAFYHTLKLLDFVEWIKMV